MILLGLVTVLLMAVCPLTLSLYPGYGGTYPAGGVGSTLDQDDPTPAGVPEQWFKQKLDHFNPADTRYWQQRYYVNDTFYKAGGPVFLYIGPETTLPGGFVRRAAYVEYAKTYNAMVFALEHRFYGKSRPTSDQSTANLKYLTVEQALEDLATFITTTNKERRFKDPKWVTFGGSYGGMLSAWVRYKFPHLVSGAVADSAPVAAPVCASEYAVGLGEGLLTVPGCYEAVEAAFNDIRYQLKSDTGTKHLKDLFRMCDFDRTKKLDVGQVMHTLIQAIQTTVQYSGDNMEHVTGGIPKRTVASMCKILTDQTRGQPLDRFADYANIVSKNYTTLKEFCQEVSFDSLLAKGNKVRFEDNQNQLTDRNWKYQVCTQIGVFVTTDRDNQPFGDALNADYYFKICEGLFGSNFNRSLLTRGHEDITINYGGLGIQATNVVYTQGSFDPWIKYGFTKDPNPRSHAIVISGVGHVADIYSSSPLDIPELKEARAKIERYIGQWISSSNIGLIG